MSDLTARECTDLLIAVEALTRATREYGAGDEITVEADALFQNIFIAGLRLSTEEAKGAMDQAKTILAMIENRQPIQPGRREAENAHDEALQILERHGDVDDA